MNVEQLENTYDAVYECQALIDRIHIFQIESPYVYQSDILYDIVEILQKTMIDYKYKLDISLVVDIENQEFVTELIEDDQVSILIDGCFDGSFPALLNELNNSDAVFVVLDEIYQASARQMLLELSHKAEVPIFCITLNPLHYMSRRTMYLYLMLSGYISTDIESNLYENLVMESDLFSYDDDTFINFYDPEITEEPERYTLPYLSWAINKIQTRIL